MKKSLIFWFAAATCAAWILVGCEQEAKTEYVTQKEMIHLDVFAADETDLREALTKTGNLSIGLSDVTLTDDLTIPAGKLVYILDSTGGLDPSSSKLTVEGQVYVGVGGTLTASSSGVVAVTTGTVHVVKGGTLDIDVADSVNDGAAKAATVLGTAKVGFASETTLKLGTGVSVNDVKAALGYFSNGTLVASASTAVQGLKPSVAVTEFGTLVSATKTLVITTSSTAETETTLSVPAGLALTTSDDLDTVTTLTVNGTAVFSGAAAPSGNVTVNGTVIVPTSGSLTIDTGKTLNIAQGGIVALMGTGSVVLTPAQATTGGAKITGAGKLTAQDTEISGGEGGWTANSSGTSGKPITTIASTATPGQATITGTDDTDKAVLTGGAGATITQKAGTTDNKLTLTTVTIDLSAAGNLTLKGDATNGASVVLVAATAIIKGTGTAGAVTTNNITAIGSVTVTGNLTVGANVVFSDDATGHVFETIKGAASDNAITAKVDLTLDKTTTLAYSG